MQASKLPIEVCERVVDSLAISVLNPTLDDHFNAVRSNSMLYACALVCRDWTYRSQHHLFRQVRLCTTNQAYAFLDAIARHPHRAKSVQYLEISPSPPPSPSPLPKPASSPPSPSDSQALASSLVPTLPLDPPAPSTSQLTTPSSSANDRQSKVGETHRNPAHLSTQMSSRSVIPLRGQARDKLKKSSIPPCYYNWIYKLLIRLPPLLNNLSTLALYSLPTLHPRFIRLVSCFKSVKTLRLWGLLAQSLSEIIQLINRLPQLTFLDINSLKWERPARFFPSHRLRLQHLLCFLISDGMRSDVLDWLGSLQHLSGLRSLRFLSQNHSDTNKLYHILHQCTNSLRYLDLYLFNADVYQYLSLSSHSRLEYLNIWIASGFLTHAVHFPPCIPQLLSPSLIYLGIGNFENLDPESFAASPSSWEDVDDALNNPKFNRLTYFVMQLDSEDKGTLDRETLRTTLKKIFPKSYQRGILWVAKRMDNSEWRAFHICEDDEHDFNVVELSNSYLRM